uniref:Uncharacterized protein n=1 Tax=Nelumbo nucifera TaxID=4432 RepID=A0A822XJ37_NELNU|nr:TPA_asm: hypothetical protein HUJ06_021883 [Nelumbo nucifera]
MGVCSVGCPVGMLGGSKHDYKLKLTPPQNAPHKISQTWGTSLHDKLCYFIFLR